MLNKDNIRELAYVVIVDEIRPIAGRDRVECAVVGGWTCMVPKGAFNAGDPGIYFEIDSKCPETDQFKFLEKYHYKIKTQKFKTPNGQFWSQGLLMHASDFNWAIDEQSIYDSNNIEHKATDESRFLTKILGVTYADAEDNKRKANSVDKYKKMMARRPQLFKKNWARWMMKYEWGRRTMFLFFGRPRDKKGGWPAWVKKTDEERVENMPWILENKEPWVATEKIDGTSTTFTMKRKKLGRNEFYVCSRNVCFDKPNKKCFYETNVYTEMAEKYHMEEVLTDLLKKYPHAKWVTIQGETYGDSIQKRRYSLENTHDLCVFNLIVDGPGRLPSVVMFDILKDYDIPCVPILDSMYTLPDTIEELRTYVNSEHSRIDGKMREGIVFRDLMGQKSFKCVSPEYLMKYHG